MQKEASRTSLRDASPADDARKNAAKQQREMYTAICANCGAEAKVPFQPRNDRPVYCSECFAKMKEEQANNNY